MGRSIAIGDSLSYAFSDPVVRAFKAGRGYIIYRPANGWVCFARGMFWQSGTLPDAMNKALSVLAR
jgi:hypothetical protein